MSDLFDTILLHDQEAKLDYRHLFLAYHAVHPRVYSLFKRFTLEVIDRGFENYSADAIMHRVRWETAITTQPQPGKRLNPDEPFKVNNNYVAHYARMFMAEFPRYDGFFRTRGDR
jgi:hypothetical protein